MGLSELLIVVMVAALITILVGMGILIVVWNTKKQQSAVGVTRQRQEEMLGMAQQSLDAHRENRDLLREIRDLLREHKQAQLPGADSGESEPPRQEWG